MRSDKSLAIKLRVEGKTYTQISLILKVPKSTLSTWLKNIKLSEKAQEIIAKRVSSTAITKLIARNQQQTIDAQKRHEEIRESAKKEFLKLMSDPLFISGICLYWAEGYKRGAYGAKQKNIDFCNSEPEMIKLMIEFFQKFLLVAKEEISIQLMLHNPKDSELALNYWSNLTKISKKNFIKICYSISRASSGKTAKRLKYGTIHLRIYNITKFFRLIGWIEGLKEKYNT